MLRFILIGRTGSGLKYLMKLIEEKGIKVAKSYTTRPQRDENDTCHHFINNINFCKTPVLKTEHNGFEYYYDLRELKTSQVIAVDPENVESLCALFPNDVFRLIEVMASNEKRLANAVKNAEDKITAEEDFVAECEAENDAFSTFEDRMTQKNSPLNINNLCIAQVINNDFTDTADIVTFANRLPGYYRNFNRMATIIEELKANDYFNIEKAEDGTDLYTVYCKSGDDNNLTKKMPLSIMTEIALIDKEGVAILVNEWLSLEKSSFNDKNT